MNGDEPENESSAALPMLAPIDLGGFQLDIHHYLGKDYADVGEASGELPIIIEWVNGHLQSIIQERATAEDLVKELEARAWRDLHDGGWERLGYAGSKTAHAMSMAIRLDSKVAAQRQQLAVLQAWESRLINLMFALRSKLELVRTAEATNRIVFNK